MIGKNEKFARNDIHAYYLYVHISIAVSMDDHNWLAGIVTRSTIDIPNEKLRNKFTLLAVEFIMGDRTNFDQAIRDCSIHADDDRTAFGAIVQFYSVASKVLADKQCDQLIDYILQCRNEYDLTSLMDGCYTHHTFRYNRKIHHVANITTAIDAAISAITLAALCKRPDWIKP